MNNILRFPNKGELSRRTGDYKTKEYRSKKTAQHQNPSRDEVLLLRMADALDEIVLDHVLDRNLPPAEVAALFANRLGHFVRAMRTLDCAKEIDRVALVRFLSDIIKREALDAEELLRMSS